MGLFGKNKHATIHEYISSAIYAIMRKCPNAPQMLGYESVWKLKSTQLHWIVKNLSKEFKPKKEKGSKNIPIGNMKRGRG